MPTPTEGMMYRRLVGSIVALLLTGCANADTAPPAVEKALGKDPFDLQLLVEEVDAAVAADVGADSARRPMVIGQLGEGSPAQATLDATRRYVGWTLDGKAALPVQMRVGGGEGRLDTVAFVYRANPRGQPFGRALAYDDDGGDGVGSQIELRLPEDRSYVLLVRSYDLADQGTVEARWDALADGELQ